MIDEPALEALPADRTDHYDVVIVHQDEVTGCGLRTMLLGQPEVRRVSRFRTATELLEVIADLRPDVLVISSSVGPHMGPILLEETLRLQTKVLLLLRSSDREGVLRASGLPVDGFLVESGLTADGLAQALRQLRGGGMPVPPSLVRELLSEVQTGGQPERQRQLTPREHAALALLVEGMCNKHIARRLGISEHGAKRHVANVLAKLNCPNRTLAAVVAIREGLVDDPTRALQ